MKKLLTMLLAFILPFFILSLGGGEKVSAEEYNYINGQHYLDKTTVPQGSIVTGSSGQIRPLQDSILKDFQYAFVYKVSNPSVLSIDEAGNWQALKAGSVTISIGVPNRDEVPNFEDELDRYGVVRADEDPAYVYFPDVFTVEVADNNLVPVYRLYNPHLKTHLYTTDFNELTYLSVVGWRIETTAWSTRTITGDAVYRLYHSGLKVHLYTKDANEYQVLASRGWRQEGVAYRSTGPIPVYRLYHRGIRKHLYTTDENEKNVLSTRGWRYEGVAWNVE